MEFQLCSHDILSDIMARLEGSSLAAAACTCSDLRTVARDQSLWKPLCESTWPSTTSTEAEQLLSSSSSSSSTSTDGGGYAKFYADSFPLVLYDNKKPMQHEAVTTHVYPSDFVSLVDVYYKEKCILSKVLDGIPGAADVSGSSDSNVTDCQRWFSTCPFRLDLLDIEEDKSTTELGKEDDNCSRDLCRNLTQDVRLSWVLFDKRSGKAVNLSSWKPLLVQRSWLFDDDYVMRFGCVVAVGESLSPQGLAECVIEAKCTLIEAEGFLRWREISMSFEDMMGARVNGSKSLSVLSQALSCRRTINHGLVEKGYSDYERLKMEMKQRNERRESIANHLYVSVEIAVFAALCYACTLFF